MKIEEELPFDEEEEYEDKFDANIIDEYDDIFETDDVPFYDMYHRMERERALGRRDGLYE